MKRNTSIIVIAVLFCVFAVFANAGTVISLETVMLKSSSGSGAATVYLEEKRMRIDSTEGGDDITVIYDGEGRENAYYWLIDNKTQTYVEIREEELRTAASVAADAMEIARRELEDAPPEQRREMERVYAERMGYSGFIEEETDYEKVSSGIKIGKWNCTHYQGFREGEKVEEVWAAGLEHLGIPAEDLSALEDLAKLFRTVGQSLPAFFRFGGDKSDAEHTFPGFPVMVVSYDRGQPSEKSMVKKIEKRNLDTNLFALPEGLTKRTGPGPGQ